MVDDILIADFEGENYAGWTPTGTAFGTAPARGMLPDQMWVSGFIGKGLVNSFSPDGAATGTLTSPPFRIERPYINFLIGGSALPGETCMNLLVDGAIVCSAIGSSTASGGSEQLFWRYWDVTAYLGQEATLQILDQSTEAYAHILVDQIVQSAKPKVIREGVVESVPISASYLHFPVTNGAQRKWFRLLQDGKILREFELELAEEGEPDFWIPVDVKDYQGDILNCWVEQLDRDTDLISLLKQGDTILGDVPVYQEAMRPQIHFTARRGWLNDPNGMVFYNGEYHLFFQHNAYGWDSANKSWGHAVSKDLVHWTELQEALYPDELGQIYSGSAVIDTNNTAGFQQGDETVMVCFYTNAGGTNRWSEGKPFTQSLAYSHDDGRSWTRYDGNPVIGHISGENRDPKVFWHDESEQWVMVLYTNHNVFAFLTSDNLRDWQLQSELKCFFECPELFKLPVVDDPERTKWILYGAHGEYFIGDFDGKTFTPEGDALRYHYGDCFYASQTFNHVPVSDGRRIQMAWGRVDHPGMPFNQMMTFPVALTLHDTAAGLRMQCRPVSEIHLLHRHQHCWEDLSFADLPEQFGDTDADCFHIQAEIEPAPGSTFGFTYRGMAVRYDVDTAMLRCGAHEAPLALPDSGILHLELLLDRSSIEIFADYGRIYMPVGLPWNPEPALYCIAQGEGVCRSMKVAGLASMWER